MSVHVLVTDWYHLPDALVVTEGTNTQMVRAPWICDRRIMVVDWTYSSTIFLYVEISFA